MPQAAAFESATEDLRPEYLRQNPEVYFDLFHVDGGHQPGSSASRHC